MSSVSTGSPDPSSEPSTDFLEKLNSKFGWVLTAVLSLLAVGGIAYLGRATLTNPPVEILSALTLMLWFALLVLLVLKINDPIHLIVSSAGRKCPILVDLQEARAYFMGELLALIKPLPSVRDEELDNADKLVQAAGQARRIMDGVGRARNLRGGILALLIIIPPIALVLAFVLSVASTTSYAYAVYFLVGGGTLLPLYILLVTSSKSVFDCIEWGNKVMSLSGLDSNGIRRKVSEWAERKED